MSTVTTEIDKAAGADVSSALLPGDSEPSLKRKALFASAWTLGGYGLSQLLRLGSNLLLTRLLFPEAFGLMQLVFVFITALQMFSDVGIGPSIIQNKRGKDPDFLNTAWTIQVVRGVILCLITFLITWPAAIFYEEPQLVELLPVVALITVLGAMNSTSLFTCNRELDLARLTMLNLGTLGLTIVTMVIWAWVSPSVWALVGGTFVGIATNLVLSHCALPGTPCRFHWDKESADSLFKFGRWIFLSTVITFILMHGDRVILGKIFTTSDFGVYSIAVLIIGAVVGAVSAMSRSVLFPVYAKLAKSECDQKLRRNTYRVRVSLTLVFLPMLWGLAILGPQIIEILYDVRYADAGWMLQILAVGGIGHFLELTVAGILLAVGDSFRHMLLQAIRSVLFLTGVLVGFQWAGVPGLLSGIAASQLLSYFIIVALIRKYGVWLPWLDVLILLSSVAVVGTGLMVMN